MIAFGTPPDPGPDTPTSGRALAAHGPDPKRGDTAETSAPELDHRFPLGDGTADTSAEVRCPYCGEEVELAVDPGGGSPQRYVEDCEVCCRPWRVTVTWDERGAAAVEVRTEDD